MEIEKVLKYFGNCKKKHVSFFEEETPDGNVIKGYICLKPNRYLGSLFITELNGEPYNRFVQSMPKIHYYQHYTDISVYDNASIIAYEKLDGSCLILYPLFDNDSNIIEIVPKTRGRAVADKNFIQLYNKCDKSPIKKYYEHNNGVLFFEMFGIMNQHEIIHYQTGIDLRIIGCYTTRFYKGKAIEKLSKYGFKQPDKVFECSMKTGDKRILITSDKFKWYFDFDDFTESDFIITEALDIPEKMEYFLSYLNKKFEEENGRLGLEGVVINCSNTNGVQKYLKVKPSDIKEKHTCQNGIPRRVIQKEVFKYFDEYGADVEIIYKEDKNHHTEYLYRMLSEEFSDEIINKSKRRIEKVFMSVWDSKVAPVSIHNICDELIRESADDGIVGCMRSFSEQYPSKKSQSSVVYQTLVKKFKQMGLKP